jgi:hypothetical protein
VPVHVLFGGGRRVKRRQRPLNIRSVRNGFLPSGGKKVEKK